MVKKASFSNNDDNEMELGLSDGREVRRHSVNGFKKIYEMSVIAFIWDPNFTDVRLEYSWVISANLQNESDVIPATSYASGAG